MMMMMVVVVVMIHGYTSTMDIMIQRSGYRWYIHEYTTGTCIDQVYMWYIHGYTWYIHGYPWYIN
jgi:hypothetical protein